MHETSLGGTLRDYLTGEDVDETTFEEFRQALVKFLVEEKGFPKDNIKPKVKLEYSVDGEDFERPLDYVVYDDANKPIFVIIFCSGEVGSYERETVCAGRLVPDGPVAFALVTDTMHASLMNVMTGDVVARGMEAVPNWERLLKMVEGSDVRPLTAEQRERQTRVFHTYCGFLFGTCCNESCPEPFPSKKD
jgi:hypothetical protein